MARCQGTHLKLAINQLYHLAMIKYGKFRTWDDHVRQDSHANSWPMIIKSKNTNPYTYIYNIYLIIVYNSNINSNINSRNINSNVI